MPAAPIRPLALVVAWLLAAMIGGCASTTITTVWKADQPPPDFHKVLAVVSNASPAERRAGEDELAAQFTRARAVPSYTLINDQDVRARDRVTPVLVREGFDGVAVIRLVSSATVTRYVPPQYSSSYDVYGDAGVIQEFSSSGYTTEDTTITCEVNLFSFQSGQSTLIWAGSSATVNPSGIKDLVVQISRASVQELKRQKLIR